MVDKKLATRTLDRPLVRESSLQKQIPLHRPPRQVAKVRRAQRSPAQQGPDAACNRQVVAIKM